MYHLRNVFWWSVLFNFDIKCVNVAGVDNIYADSISRLRDRGHMLHWLSVDTGGAPSQHSLVYHHFIRHMSP